MYEVTRKNVTIADKLKVVKYWHSLCARKKKLMESVAKESVATKKSFKSKSQLKRKRGFNMQAQCKAKFPDIVGKTQVCKWVSARKREGWDDIPDALRQRLLVLPNTIRAQRGLGPRGHPEGGRVPLVLQRELDTLISEVTHGRSEITTRQQIVTVDQIAPGTFQHCFLSCLTNG